MALKVRMLFQNTVTSVEQCPDGQINVTVVLQWLKTEYKSSEALVDWHSFD